MAPKLLLADDSVTIQRVIELTFADENIQVIAVGDGQQAIEQIEAARPDVILADVGMPEKDGYDVASYVKGQPHLQHIPVVLLTGAFEPVDEARAHAIGCDGVLVKPFEPQMVINRVKDLLAGRRPQGLWATPPGQPARAVARTTAPSAGAEFRPVTGPSAGPEPQAAASADSLDDYFDRLDAAFATLHGEEAPAGQAEHAAPAPRPERVFDRYEATGPPPPDEAFSTTLDRWDPSLSDEEPAPAPAAGGRRGLDARQSAPDDRPAVAPPSPHPPAAPPPVVAVPSLSDAFAALLAAEQGQAAAPPRAVASAPAPAASAAALSDELIEKVVQRVIQRITTGAVRDTVLQVAERLVREEIARIKNAAP